MEKKYIKPNTDIHDLIMQYSLLEHSEHLPGDEEDEFNVKELNDVEMEEEYLWEIENDDKFKW